MALRAMPSAAQEEPEDEVLARIRVLLTSAKARDKQKDFPDCTLGEREALADWENQNGRCAITANKLTCVPKKLNSFRYVILPLTICCRALTLPPQH